MHRLLSSSADEVKLGPLLGSGSFCCVFQVSLQPSKPNSSSPSLRSTQEPLLNPCETSYSYYALKRLHKPEPNKAKALITEARILSYLEPHEHIVTLRGLSKNFWDAPERGFLLLDKLNETLRQVLRLWRTGQRSDIPPQKKVRTFRIMNPANRSQLRREAQSSRIKVAMIGLARALEFLHNQGFLFRDFKPENVGFDAAGNVRLFDFGAAVDMKGKDTICPARILGTTRYMAPEVQLRQPYGYPVDVHSFAMVLWEVCALEKPYSNAVSDEGLQDMLIKGKIRPSLRAVASPIITQLLRQCWNPDPLQRATFATIVDELECEAARTNQIQ